MGIKQIRTTHAGALPRSEELTGMIRRRAAGGAVDEELLEQKLSAAVAEAVRRSATVGSTASMMGSSANRISCTT
jgi:methionine synthase II (cobalamin-independent)